MKDLPELTRQTKNGNKKAFRELYDRFHVPLFYVAKKYVKDEQLAEDAVQDIFLKLWKKRETLDPGKSVKAFMFTMLKNHLLNLIRDRKKKVHSGYEALNEEELEHSDKTDEQVMYQEYEDIFEKGLNELSPGKKEVFRLKTEQGLSNQEVADQREVSVTTVKSQYYRGSQFIRAYLRKHANISS